MKAGVLSATFIGKGEAEVARLSRVGLFPVPSAGVSTRFLAVPCGWPACNRGLAPRLRRDK